MRGVHIFATFFDDFQKLRCFQGESFGVVKILLREGVFRVLRVHGLPEESALSCFWTQGTPRERPKFAR